MRRIAVLSSCVAAVLLALGCRAAKRDVAQTAPVLGAPPGYETISAVPLGVQAGLEAHRRGELRRHLAFLEALEPGYVLRTTAARVEQATIDAGEVATAELYEVGRILFEHEYDFADGLGSGKSREMLASGTSPFRRVHEGGFGGPETTTCTSCHWRGGPAGAGGLQDNSFIYGDGDRVDSADPRNPPPLHGVGAVEALAAEMSRDLQTARARLIERARQEGREVEGPVVAKGVSFGVLRASADGSVDASRLEGVDADLVVKPFGWKGTFATIREFVAESLQVHFGIQAEDLVHGHRKTPDPELLGHGPESDDPDGDGVRRELTSGQLTALVAYLAMLEMPIVRPPETFHDLEPPTKNTPTPIARVFLEDWWRGRALFEKIGCARCHVPMLVLDDPRFRTRSPVSGGTLEIDLSREAEHPRLQHDPRVGGYPVWLFSDLKRHDLGGRNASKHVDHGVPHHLYLTRRLWGLASSPPYFYDGHASWFDDAIDAHLGEATDSRKAFFDLDREGKNAVRMYLMSLRRERRLVVP